MQARNSLALLCMILNRLIVSSAQQIKIKNDFMPDTLRSAEFQVDTLPDIN